MDTEHRAQIEAGLDKIRNRVQCDMDKAHELVSVDLKVLLQGQEAVNYEVAKLFADGMNHQELVQTLFRIGLKNAMELVKAIAQKNGIGL
jgi:hypothetical protein